MLATLAMMLIGAGVGIHVEDSRGVSGAEVEVLAEILRAQLEARGQKPVVVDRGGSKPACTQTDRCVDAIRARTEASDIVLLRVFGVPTRIRVIAERAGGERTEIDLPRSKDTWAAALGGVAARLFPIEEAPKPVAVAAVPPKADEPPRRPELVPKVETAPPAPDETRWVPWAIIGGGALAGAIGIGFGLSSKSARDTAASEMHTAAELDDLESRAIGHGLAANILFGVAAAGIGTGVVLLLLDD